MGITFSTTTPFIVFLKCYLHVLSKNTETLRLHKQCSASIRLRNWSNYAVHLVLLVNSRPHCFAIPCAAIPIIWCRNAVRRRVQVRCTHKSRAVWTLFALTSLLFVEWSVAVVFRWPFCSVGRSAYCARSVNRSGITFRECHCEIKDCLNGSWPTKTYPLKQLAADTRRASFGLSVILWVIGKLAQYVWIFHC